jgi:hypothetical protein
LATVSPPENRRVSSLFSRVRLDCAGWFRGLGPGYKAPGMNLPDPPPSPDEAAQPTADALPADAASPPAGAGASPAAKVNPAPAKAPGAVARAISGFVAGVRRETGALAREPQVTLPRWGRAITAAVRSSVGGWREYFGSDVNFTLALAPFLVISALVYTRSFWTNYIFDEQEALLANPYVNGTDLHFWDVFKRDFWGLPPTRTIGSYRPLPNIIWWLVWKIKQHAWLPHFVNVILHAVNGALLATIAQRWFSSRLMAWLSGLALVLAAVITEAVAGVVGLADVMGGTFILLCLWGLRWRWYWSGVATYLFLFLGLLCKESTLTVTPIVGWAALVAAPLDNPVRPQRFLRFSVAALGAVAAVITYEYFRRHFFPIKLPPELEQPLPDTEPFVKWAFHEFLRWFQQPKFAADPINNPLAVVDPPYRVAGALRIYLSGLWQVICPWTLSGDYSFPQEPAPEKLVFFGSIFGGLLMLGPPLLAIGIWGRGVWLEFTRRFQLATWSDEALLSEGTFLDQSGTKFTWLSARLRKYAVIAIAAMWVPFTYFPQSNIPISLPTVRAERFWYVPVLGTSLLIAWAFAELWKWADARGKGKYAVIFMVVFFGFQGVRGRMHALDYRNDLTFWRATAQAVPRSGKAHLNYGVMLGARQRLEERLVENRIAMELAPKWPMANIYYGDTLCRLHRPDEAFPNYQRGFDLGPNDQYMIALALQCLWDEKAFERHKPELQAQADKYKGSWVAFLVNDMITNGEKNAGVDPKYRPRGYNQGPRKE